MRGSLAERLAWSNSETMIICMIEDVGPAGKVQDILSVDNIDMVLIGPGDLAQSMGFPEISRVGSVIDDILAQAQIAKKPVGFDLSQLPEERARKMANEGVQFSIVAPTRLLIKAAFEHKQWTEDLYENA